MNLDDLLRRYEELRGMRLPSDEEGQLEIARWLERHLVPEDALELGHDPANGRAVYLLPENLKTHLQVIGWTQRGKTNFLKCLAKSLLDRHEATGEGLAIIDPHGGLAEFLFDHCAAKGRDFAEHVVYFDLREQGKVPLFNPLRREYGVELVAQNFVEAVAKALGKQFTMQSPLIAEILRNTVQVLLHNDLSLAEAGFFTRHTEENVSVRSDLVEQVQDKSLRDFWIEFAQLSAKDKRAETAPAARRFDYLLSVPTVRRIVGQCELGIDLGEVMDEGKIAIFNLTTEGTEVPLEAQHLLGALLVQEFRAVTLRRKAGKARPFYLLIDEFGQFVSHDVMRVFTEAAKFGLRCILAHQGMWQLMLAEGDTQLRESIMSIGQKVIFGGGSFPEHLALAQQVYGSTLDLSKRKLELWNKAFTPMLEKEILHSGGIASITGHTETSAESHAGGASGSRGSESSEDEMLSWQETTARQTGGSEAVSESVSAGWHEAYVTRYKEFAQLSSVQFEDLAEQLFKKAQHLFAQGIGRCVVAGALGSPPQDCQLPLAEEAAVSDEERLAFRTRVYEKPYYLTPAEADRQIEHRKVRLLRAAGVDEVRIDSLQKAKDFAPEDVWEKEEKK